MSKPQAEGPPLFGYSQLFIQYIHNSPLYLEVVCSICSIRTYHAVL